MVTTERALVEEASPVPAMSARTDIAAWRSISRTGSDAAVDVANSMEVVDLVLRQQRDEVF
jgi:hypothetical protein